MGLGIVPFAAALGGAGGIEIAQAGVPQTISARVPVQNALESKFRFAVGITRVRRISFGYWLFLWLAVSRRRRRKNKLAHPAIAHRIKQVQAGYQIVTIVLRRLLNRFTNQRIR